MRMVPPHSLCRSCPLPQTWSSRASHHWHQPTRTDHVVAVLVIADPVSAVDKHAANRSKRLRGADISNYPVVADVHLSNTLAHKLGTETPPTFPPRHIAAAVSPTRHGVFGITLTTCASGPAASRSLQAGLGPTDQVLRATIA
jgi:hypothetical protein